MLVFSYLKAEQSGESLHRTEQNSEDLEGKLYESKGFGFFSFFLFHLPVSLFLSPSLIASLSEFWFFSLSLYLCLSLTEREREKER